MPSNHKISKKQEAVRMITEDRDALSKVDPKIKSNISFTWGFYRIQSEMNDYLRKKHIHRFMIQDGLKLFASLAIIVVSAMMMAGVIVLPIPFLAVITIASLVAAISAFYAIYKVTQHTKGSDQGVKKLQSLPDDILLEIGKFTSESDEEQLAVVSKTMHSIFQPPKVLNKFLQCVALGKQDQVEQLFKGVYSGQPNKIQEALRYRGVFTDYSGRTFNCTAYEYAYWAKDTHMCRMLECHMDEDTRAKIFARITTNDETGLSYQQNGTGHRSAHFDLRPLKDALRAYLTGHDAWLQSKSWAAVDDAWLAVGMAQREVPAHVAQEYCRPDRSFAQCPEFDEASLPRILSFYNYYRLNYDSWFPLSDLGDHGPLALTRGSCLDSASTLSRHELHYHLMHREAKLDLAAITRLDEVRTNDLELSRANLNPAASLHAENHVRIRELNKFLQCVAFGKQDQVEQLFKGVYSGQPNKIQEALRYRGVFTDYSGRTFNCTAYEYAYWAKDTHMCRMLECHMDEDTKAHILDCIITNDETGLCYQQNVAEHRSAHFDLTPLKDALRAYITGHDALVQRESWSALQDAWLEVGMAQREVPAHVAQEYCRPDRSFYPCPEFNDSSLPRILSLYQYCHDRTWFPLSHGDGLGFDFSCVRTAEGGAETSVDPLSTSEWQDDLLAITRLDEVRTADLELSRSNLSSARSLRQGV